MSGPRFSVREERRRPQLPERDERETSTNKGRDVRETSRSRATVSIYRHNGLSIEPGAPRHREPESEAQT
jgi:hypothetical protein